MDQMKKNTIEQRSQLANDYDKRNDEQLTWYSNKASDNKSYFQSIGICIVVFGALISIMPVISWAPSGSHNVSEIITTILGAFIVILKGVERIWLPEESWQNYRKASEALKIERERYIENVTPYSNTAEEDIAFKLFVERCILIKLKEQNNFWELNSSANKPESEKSD